MALRFQALGDRHHRAVDEAHLGMDLDRRLERLRATSENFS